MYFVQADRLDYLRLGRDLKPVLKKQSTEACLFGLTILFLLMRTLFRCVELFWVCGNCVRWTKDCNDMVKPSSSLIFKGGV